MLKNYLKELHLSINPRKYNAAEQVLWARLRSIEWGHWPAFITQPVAPFLLIFLPWHLVVLGVFGINVLWSFVRYHLVSSRLATAGALFVQLKWLSSIVAAVILLARHNYIGALLSLLWPVVTIIITLFPRNDIEVGEKLFLERID